MSRACPTCRTSYPDAAFFCGNDGAITLEEPSDGVTDPRIGQRLGGYLIVARVADGAMGRVYEGRHPESRARVAIKVLHDKVARDHVAVERFKREYDVAHEMQHPHIVKVLEFGETADHSLFMTMEYLEGRELSKALANKRPLAKSTIVRSVCQTALALDHAHSFGFIHRDLKPDNIFLCDTPAGVDVRILDFGSVKLQMDSGPKLTALGTTLGSPYYMSPEQAMGQSDVDQRSDVFALGAILWEMVTGRVAFEGPTVAAILKKILNDAPAPASTLNRESPPALDDVIDKAVRKDKQRRYEAAGTFAQNVISAYGLTGSVEHWGRAPEAEIDRALAAAVPPAPKPFGHSLAPTAATAAAAAGAVKAAGPTPPGATSGTYQTASSLRPAGLPARNKMWVGIAIGFLLVVSIVFLATR